MRPHAIQLWEQSLFTSMTSLRPAWQGYPMALPAGAKVPYSGAWLLHNGKGSTGACLVQHELIFCKFLIFSSHDIV